VRNQSIVVFLNQTEGRSLAYRVASSITAVALYQSYITCVYK
jgi:hypothetical protein